MISPSARAFAIQAHGSQKYGPHPYICHLDQVHQIIHNCYPTDFDLLDASYLHDVLEDTSITQLELAKVFGPRISSLVYAVTDCPGSSRSERKILTYFKIRPGPQTHQDVPERVPRILHGAVRHRRM
jgi:(p)ppGpp synthase/HD superfamily hydrolase